MLIPALPFMGGYILTYALYKLKLIRKALHINIWNFIIGLAFLISGLGGFALLLLLEFGVRLPINSQLLYWHVEFGITLFLVTVFHFHTYWKSAKNMFVAAKRRSRA